MSTSVTFAIIAVLVVIIAGFFAWRRWKGKREGFSLSTPAAPRVREAIGDLFGALKAMVTLGRNFDTAVKDNPQFATARQGVAHITANLDRATTLLVESPPTYVNYLAVYRGLADSDRQLLAASDAYIKAGHGVQQNVYRTDSGAEADIGNTLTAMGRQLRLVVGAVHRLGVALDVE